jgi:hypothetical protein
MKEKILFLKKLSLADEKLKSGVLRRRESRVLHSKSSIFQAQELEDHPAI